MVPGAIMLIGWANAGRWDFCHQVLGTGYNISGPGAAAGALLIIAFNRTSIQSAPG